MALLFSSRTLSRGVSGLAGLALVSLTAVGCVSQEDWQALKMDRDNLAEQLADAEAEARGASKLAEGYRDQLARIANGEQADDARLANFQSQIAALTGERDELMSKYEAMLGKIGTGPALPEALTSELTEFANANPDLVTFDPDRGIVKFKSDVTFQSGDAELTPDAKSVIDRFGSILNAPIARQYELRIAGHTDNVNNFSAATKQKGHKDNWYLASHRAISVAKQLQGQGVSANRMGVTGFADQRPVASNASAAGRAQNRRVEVLILPTTVNTATPATPAAPATEETATADVPAQEQPAAPVETMLK